MSRRWPLHIRVAVCTDIARGLPQREAADKHGVPHGTAARWWSAYLRDGGTRPPAQPGEPPAGPRSSGTFLLADLREADRARILRFKDLALTELSKDDAFDSADSVEKVGRVALALNRVARVFPDLMTMNEKLADDAGTGGRSLDEEAREVVTALELDNDADFLAEVFGVGEE